MIPYNNFLVSECCSESILYYTFSSIFLPLLMFMCLYVSLSFNAHFEVSSEKRVMETPNFGEKNPLKGSSDAHFPQVDMIL